LTLGTIASSSQGSEDRDGLGSCHTHNVDFSPQEDRSRSEGTLGEVHGGEEDGGLEPPEPITRIVLHSYSSEE
jgi:hypothetical protein